MLTNGFRNFRQFLIRQVGLRESLISSSCLLCLFVLSIYSWILLLSVSHFDITLSLILTLFIFRVLSVLLGISILWLVLSSSHIFLSHLLLWSVLTILVLTIILIRRIMTISQPTDHSSLSIPRLSRSLFEILSIFVISIINDLVILLM